MMRKPILTIGICLLFGLGIELHAQDQAIGGQVIDSHSGEVLPGVNILIKGTTTGTSTDQDGNFELEVSSLQDTLVVSFVGYQTKEVPINGRTEIDIQLAVQAIFGEEMVVVGYGEQRQSEVTGSVGSIEIDEELASRPLTDFGSAMYGKIAGVQVQSASGRPGESSTIMIRGINSLSADVMPLLVVDGVVLPGYDLSTINSSDIESIEVLKDAASAAIYGSRGSNGVVLVTTKDGERGESHVTFNYTYSIQEQMNYIDMMDGPQYAQAAIDAAQNGWIDSGGDPNAPNTIEARGEYKYTWPEALENPKTLWNTDFQRLISRVAPMHKADLSVSGGDKNSKYYISAGFLNQKGIIVSSDFQRLNLNLKGDSQIDDWLTVGGMANISRNEENVINGSLMNAAREYPSIYPVYGNNGYLGGPMSVDGFENYYNILMRADNQGHPFWHTIGFEDVRNEFNVIGNLFAEIEIFPDLTFKSTFNTAYNRGDSRQYERNERGVERSYRAEANSDMDKTLNYTSENILTYVLSGYDHQVDAMAGYEFNHREYYSLAGDREVFDNDLIPYLSGGNVITNSSDEVNASNLISFFGRLNYGYLGKYMASVTFRRDGSSRFGPAKKWSNFPSFSAGWRVSDEDFMNGVDFLNNLTIRASYGISGNDGIGNYAWIAPMNKTQTAIGDNLTSSYSLSGIQNPELAWERSRQFNIGFDISLINERILFEGDLYRSESDGLLLNVPVPSITGFTNVLENIGAVETKGIEFNITSHNLRDSELSWSSHITFSSSRGQVTKLGPDDAPVILSPTNMDVINKIGESPFSFYAYKYDGVYKNQKEIDDHGVEYQFDVHPGDGRYVDINGDGIINSDDRTIIGNPEPDFIWGIGNTFQYKSFDLSIQFDGHVGGQIYNAQTRRSIFNHEGRNYFAMLSENAWRSEEKPGDGYHYKLSVDIDGLEKQPSSYWLTDAGYTRLRNVTLGYNLPSKYTQKFGLTSLRIFFNGVNLLDWREGELISDPENSQSVNDPAQMASQHNPYPTARIYSFGFNVNF